MSTTPKTDFTVALPNGTTNHGNPDLICVPATWHDILIFFATNYVVHTATALSMPGETLGETAFVLFACLVLPASALSRSYRAIVLHAVLKSDPLERATRSHALCMVKSTKIADNGGSKSHEANGQGLYKNNPSSKEALGSSHGPMTALPKPSASVESQKAAMDTQNTVKQVEGVEFLPRTDGVGDQDIEKTPTMLVFMSLSNISL